MRADIHEMAKSTKALLTGRIQKCKTNPSVAHIGLATHGRSIQRFWQARHPNSIRRLQSIVVTQNSCLAPIVDADYVGCERRGRGPSHRKGLVLQPDVVPLGSRRPAVSERPLNTGSCRPAKIAAAGAVERGRCCPDRNRWIVCPDPSTAALTIKQHTVPAVAKLAGCGR